MTYDAAQPPYSSSSDFRRWVAGLVPGGGDATAYASAVADLTDGQLVDAFAAVCRGVALLEWVAGRLAAETLDRASPQAARGDGSNEVQRPASTAHAVEALLRSSRVSELAAVTGTSSRSVLRLAENARTLQRALPGVDDLAARGEVDHAKTRMVLEAARRLAAGTPPPAGVPSGGEAFGLGDDPDDALHGEPARGGRQDRAQEEAVARRWGHLDRLLRGLSSAGLAGITDLATRSRSSLAQMLGRRVAHLAGVSAAANRTPARPGIRLRPIPGCEGWSALTVVGLTPDLAMIAEALRRVATGSDLASDDPHGRSTATCAEHDGQPTDGGPVASCADTDGERATPPSGGDVPAPRHGERTGVSPSLDGADLNGPRADAPASVAAEPLGVGQSQVAVLLSWALHAVAAQPLDPGGKPVPRIELVVLAPLAALEGRPDSPAGWMPGHGLIPSDLVRTLARHATVRLGVTDDVTGRLLALGATVLRPTAASGYSAPAWLRRFITVDRPQCTFPGCTRPPSCCDLDHSTAYPDGRTDAATLHPLCRHHHRIKTLTDWTVTVDESTGQVVWTTPTGRTVTTDHDVATVLDLSTPASGRPRRCA